MRRLYKSENTPWLCGDDFNVMLWSSEKQLEGVILSSRMQPCLGKHFIFVDLKIYNMQAIHLLGQITKGRQIPPGNS